MCRPASFVLTKDRVYWSMKTDSHTEIISENELHEDGVRGPNVVKVEISPTDGRLDSDHTTWHYKLDQDVTPEWYDAGECEKRARVELAKWVEARVLTEGEHRVVDGVYFAYDSSTVTACGSSTVTACDSSTVRAYDSSTVTACDSSTVRAYDSSTVTACDSSTVRACDSSTVSACEHHATVRHYADTAPAVAVGEFAVVIDCTGASAVVQVGEALTA